MMNQGGVSVLTGKAADAVDTIIPAITHVAVDGSNGAVAVVIDRT